MKEVIANALNRISKEQTNEAKLSVLRELRKTSIKADSGAEYIDVKYLDRIVEELQDD